MAKKQFPWQTNASSIDLPYDEPIDVPSMGDIQEEINKREKYYPGSSGSTSEIPDAIKIQDAIPPFPGADEDEWSGFRNWLGEEAPGGAFDPQFVDPSFDPSQQGTLGYQDTGPMAERWAPWDAPSGPGQLWNWPTSDAPKYAGQVQSGWDLSSMRGGTGPYLQRSPEEEDRITTVRRALGEYRDAPFADKADTLEDWRQKYHGNVQAYGQAQEEQRSAAVNCIAAGGTPVVEGGQFVRCDMPEVIPPEVITTPPPLNGEDVITTPPERRKQTDSELPDTRLLSDQAPIIDPTGRIPPEEDVVPFMEAELEDPLVVETGVDPLSKLTNLRLGGSDPFNWRNRRDPRESLTSARSRGIRDVSVWRGHPVHDSGTPGQWWSDSSRRAASGHGARNGTFTLGCLA
jgi:hypothetical protein